jgi:hypothetical protein
MSFVMMHCWVLLQHNEKWNKRYTDQEPTKHTGLPDLNSTTWQDDDDGASNGTTSDWLPLSKRPPGRKKEKERKKRAGDVDELQDAVEKIVKAKKDIEASKKLDKDERWEYMKSLQERQIDVQERQLKVPEEEATAKKMEIDVQEKKLKVQEEEEAAKKMEQESKIMLQDLNGLDETQRAISK